MKNEAGIHYVSLLRTNQHELKLQGKTALVKSKKRPTYEKIKFKVHAVYTVILWADIYITGVHP